MSDETIESLISKLDDLTKRVCLLRKTLSAAIIVWLICVFGLVAHIIHDAVLFEEIKSIVFTLHTVPPQP